MNKKKGLFAEVKNLTPLDEKKKSRQPRKGNLREIQSLVGEVRPDDGIDPRYVVKQRRRVSGEPRPGLSHDLHKQEQLSSQVQLAIESALQCSTIPILSELTVREVVKQKSLLMVVVEPRNPAEPVNTQDAVEALQKAGPVLRREVAAAITRKEVPQLSFTFLPAGAQKVES